MLISSIIYDLTLIEQDILSSLSNVESIKLAFQPRWLVFYLALLFLFRSLPAIVSPVSWLPTSMPFELIRSTTLYLALVKLSRHTSSWQKMQQSIFSLSYLLRGLLNKCVLVATKANNQSQKVIYETEIYRISDTLGFNHQQALKRMDYFLNLLPLIWVLSQLCKIPFDNLVYFLVFFNKNKQQVMSCFSHLGLYATTATF